MKFFHSMTQRPWPYMIVLPAVLIILIGVGWSRDDIVEEQVHNIWIPTRSAFKKDKDYAAGVLREKEETDVTLFVSMAIARDGGNLFTENRLEEIRQRMEKVEATTINHKGVSYGWEDFCSSNNVGLGTTYKFPCLRLSVMDWFQEARWFLSESDRVTWYNEVIRKLLTKPRVPRFGTMTSLCSSASPVALSDSCDELLKLRRNATYAEEKGYDKSYANPLLLLDDVGSLEMNDPCKICIEEGFESTMRMFTAQTKQLFFVLSQELMKLEERGNVTNDDLIEVQNLRSRVDKIVPDRAQIEEWYYYYVVRGLYAELGAQAYQESYASFMNSLTLACQFSNPGDPTACPPNVTLVEARVHLQNHADNVFSSVSTAGAPFPFWSDGDGTGSLFSGSFPVSGSGIDMSGQFLSSTAYLDSNNYNTSEWNPMFGEGPIDPSSAIWSLLVETDPIYLWFLASVTPMTAHCGNGNLTGTDLAVDPFDINGQTAKGLAASSQRYCTKYNVPFEQDGTETQQFFAKMFYDVLVDSPSFLSIVQGEDDPYVWTLGTGCGYSLGGQRDPYTNKTSKSILFNASRVLYNVDEGASVGAIDTNVIMGGVVPPVGDYNNSNPLKTVPVIQNVYPTLGRMMIPERIGKCNRPNGPVNNVSKDDALEMLKIWKEAMEDSWTEGWDDPLSGEVQFVAFYDDQGGAIGTTGRLLRDLTLDNGKLMTISIVIIAVFSAIFLFSFDVIESRVLVTMIGVSLVLISFFAALGLGILAGIKVNVNIAWSLPFIILGLGVDDMYIVILAIKRRQSYSETSFVEAMAEVVIPVTMTSVVNLSMFAVMNIVDLPAVYLTAQMALISVIFLYLTVVFSFPAYCYLDLKRQEAGRCDVLVCLKKEKEPEDDPSLHSRDSFLYRRIYYPFILGGGRHTTFVRILIVLGAIAMLAVGSYGITKREVGLGLQDFFPSFHQAHTWATETTETIGSWGISIFWGEEDYTDPDTQLFIMRQFEQVIETPHVSETETKQLWLASFNIWMTRQCTTNFDRTDPDIAECGMDQIFKDNTTCIGFWAKNRYGGRQKNFGDGSECVVFERGVCRPTNQMHPYDLQDLGIDPLDPGNEANSSWCPVFENFSDEKLQFCLMRWHNFTGGGGSLIKNDGTRTPYPGCVGDFFPDAVIETPIRYSQGPNFFGYDLYEHGDYLDMISQTRAVCDDVDRVRCWMSGIPYNYWEQYLTIEGVLLEASCAAIGIGFVIAFAFLFIKLKREHEHPTRKVLIGSALGALLIACSCILTIVAVTGISVLIGVSMTAFSTMSFLLSIGFAIEYSVHIVHRFMKAPMNLTSPSERVEYAMSFLTLPTFMSFVSSTIGVVCLAFTKFEFNDQFFFKPLITVMWTAYYNGCLFLPVFLTVLNVDALKCGSFVEVSAEMGEVVPVVKEQESIEAHPEQSIPVEISDPVVREAQGAHPDLPFDEHSIEA